MAFDKRAPLKNGDPGEVIAQDPVASSSVSFEKPLSIMAPIHLAPPPALR
jgi:hypothetical protein